MTTMNCPARAREIAPSIKNKGIAAQIDMTLACGQKWEHHDGNGYDRASEYRIYGKDGMTTASFNYPDGGFRGWGTVIPVCYGTRRRYFWLTFDRTLMSKSYNWSYGNLYCFEAEGNFPL